MSGNRRSIRLKGYDYSREGVYYVTLCVNDRKCIFGNVRNVEMVLNDFGKTADKCWNEIPEHFPDAALDEYIVMPNHVHGIINIRIRRGTACRAPTADRINITPGERFGKPVAGSLSTIARSYKSAVAKHINQIRPASGANIWQRNYYEHIVRDEKALNGIREYITNNPAKWERDEYYFA